MNAQKIDKKRKKIILYMHIRFHFNSRAYLIGEMQAIGKYF